MSEFRRLIKSKLFIFAGLLVLASLAVVEGKQFSEKKSVQKEIDDLNTQAQSLSQKNQDLNNLISYLQTDDYKQRAARQQLGLQKSGEQVYSFADSGTAAASSSDASAAEAQAAAVPSPQSNLRKWWNYFFKPGN